MRSHGRESPKEGSLHVSNLFSSVVKSCTSSKSLQASRLGLEAHASRSNRVMEQCKQEMHNTLAYFVKLKLILQAGYMTYPL